MDVASLNISINSSDAGAANDALKKLVSTGGELEDVLKRVAEAWGLFKMYEYAKECATLSARYETLGVVMTVVGNNAGYTSAKMEEFAQALQHNGISMNESRQSLARMAEAHLDLKHASDLGRIAQDAAVIGNINSSEAFGRMIVALETGQVRMLRTIGINVNFKDAYAKLAVELHKNVNDLTEIEKAHGRTNAVIEKGRDIAGTYSMAMETAGKQLLSMQRYVEDFQTVAGSAFGDAFGEIVRAINQSFIDMKKYIVDNMQEMALLNSLFGQAAEQLIGIFHDLANISGGMTTLQAVASGVVVVIAFLRDAINTILGTVQMIWGGFEIMGSVIAKATTWVAELFHLEPPDWFKFMFTDGTKNVENGYGRAGATALNEFYNRGSQGIDPATESANLAQSRKVAALKAGQESYRIATRNVADDTEKNTKILDAYNKELDRQHESLLKLAGDKVGAMTLGWKDKKFSGKQIDTLADGEKQIEQQTKLVKIRADMAKDNLDTQVQLLKYRGQIAEATTLQMQSEGKSADYIAQSLANQQRLNDEKMVADKQSARDSAWAQEAASRQKDKLAYLQKEVDYRDKLHASAMAPQTQKDDLQKQFDTNRDLISSPSVVGGSTEYKLLLKQMIDLRMEEMKLKAQNGDTWAIMGMTIANASGAASDGLVKWMDNIHSLDQAWRSFGDTFLSVIKDVLVQMEKAIVQQQLMGPLMQWAGLSVGAPGDGVAAMGGGGDGLGPTAAGYGFDMASASGGYRDGSKPYLVGENGPEIFNPGTSGTVIPNKALGGGGDVVNHISVSVDSNGGMASSAKSSGQNGTAIASSIKDMMTQWAIEQKRPGGVLNL